MKKIILTVFAATSLLLYSTPSFAFSISVGMPMGQTIPGKDADGDPEWEPDGTSGYFIGVQLPFAVGLGVDSYKTKNKGTAKLATDIYNIFYQLPIPVINLIIGLGTGKHTVECADCKEGTMYTETYDGTEHTSNIGWKPGSVTQWYTSIGMPILPLFDIHLSYRSITSKNVVNGGTREVDFSSTVTGIGIAFNF
jgi:hypothetical protein